ncbi:MAG: glycosyltransferase family 4 protein [Candidatus Bathyarchaeota archaeon]|nr:glycosyltransferase family 4 protein [Candidatus Termiticorpusculum sp.]
MGQTCLCIVSSVFLPSVGGIQIVIYEQGRRLLGEGFGVRVVSSRLQSLREYVIGGLSVECFESMNLGFRLGIPYPIPSVSSLPLFVKNIRNCDIVHAHGHPYLSSFLAAKLARFYGKPFVLTQHNTFIDYANVFNHVERANDLIVGRETLRLADKVVVVSNATKDYVLSLGVKPSCVEVLLNGVDLDRFKPMVGVRELMRKKLGVLEDDMRVVLTVRRLVYKNGVDTFIDAARVVVEDMGYKNVLFVVVGKGPDMVSIQRQIVGMGLERNILLAGFVSDGDLASYYNMADLFVLPSKSGEGLPLVALEAMACGLPVVATDVGGVGEVLVKSFGKLIAADDPEAMAEAVVEFISVKDKANNSSNELRAVVEERFSWDRNVARLVEIYEELI